jgi:hypothetical protein
MQTRQINRHRTVDQSPKEGLRAHIDELSLEMQREFVEVALQLIAARPLFQEIEVVINLPPCMAMRRGMARQ